MLHLQLTCKFAIWWKFKCFNWIFGSYFNSRSSCVVEIDGPSYFMSYRENHCFGILTHRGKQCPLQSKRTQNVYIDSCRIYGGGDEFNSLNSVTTSPALLPLKTTANAVETNYYTSEYSPLEPGENVIQHLYSYDDAPPPHSDDDIFTDDWVPTIPANDDMVNNAPNRDPQQVWYKWERSYLNTPTAAPSLTPGISVALLFNV